MFNLQNERPDEVRMFLFDTTTVLTYLVDVKEFDQVERVVQYIELNHGGVDILVNNVGGSTLRIPVEDMSTDTFSDR